MRAKLPQYVTELLTVGDQLIAFDAAARHVREAIAVLRRAERLGNIHSDSRAGRVNRKVQRYIRELGAMARVLEDLGATL